MICSSEPIACKDSRVFTVNDCKDPRILEYCPIMCGRCISSVPRTETCPTVQCLNGATLNQDTCKCDCKYKLYKVNCLLFNLQRLSN